MKKLSRCCWCVGDPLYENYHDTQWGIPIYDSDLLFQSLCLEIFQGGLSWLTILRKKENLLRAFDDFKPHILITYNHQKIESLLQDTGIIRHKGKIQAIIHNAYMFLELQKSQSFSDYLWQYVDFQPLKGKFPNTESVPITTDISTRIAKDFKKNEFKFCGATMMYAFMQAVGMVNNHTMACYKY